MGRGLEGGERKWGVRPCHRKKKENSARMLCIYARLGERRGVRRRQTRTSDDWADVDDEDLDSDRRTIQQLATALASTDVRDGAFTARLPVDAMPHGDVMIRMRNGCLEVLQTDVDAQHCK